MTKKTYAAVIAAAALFAIPVAAQAEYVGSSADVRGQSAAAVTHERIEHREHNYTRSYEGERLDNRYDARSDSSRHREHQRAYVPGNADDPHWAARRLNNPSIEGYVGTTYLWGNELYLPDPSRN